MRKFIKLSLLFSFPFTIFSCNDDDRILGNDQDVIGQPEPTEITGFYLLNEGNLGSNKASIDFMDLASGTYSRNIYSTANPEIVRSLGDVGNDIKIYGSKIYSVINASNFIEVMDLKTARHIATIPLENGRYLTFSNGKGYATSYAGPIVADPNSPLGKVIEFDTINFNISREVTVGYQPDELEIVENKLYVANSGGYRYPDYDRTISVVDLNTFTETNKIDVEVNLYRLKKDSEGDLYVTTRGDYYQVASNLYVIDSKTHQIKKTFNIPVSNFTIVGDYLYYYSNEFSYKTFSYEKTYGIINVKTEQLVSDRLIDNPIVEQIQTPYGIAVNQFNGDVFITDAGNYVSDGFVYCFSKEGTLKWKTTAGNIPAHIAFIYQ
ncbi:MAG: YncE family protein [Flavobacteriaceae bacterium]|nr:YncE family protein [Candidatus Onthonaster equi]